MSPHLGIRSNFCFLFFSGLKINEETCEIAAIGVNKGVKVVLCGMECTDLTEDTIKIFGIYFTYNKSLTKRRTFWVILKIQNILKLWKLRNLTLEEKNAIFMSLVISKIIHLALVTEIPSSMINLLNKIQMEFIKKRKNPKIKYSTLCNEYENCGLKNVEVFPEVVSL